MAGQDDQHVRIERWLDIAGPDTQAHALDEVFFTSSAVQSFPDAAARAVFRERWLGRYLRHYPEWAFVARDAEGQVAGYVIGSPDDPALTPLFDDIGYFKEIPHLTRRFPAQLHVNVRADMRGCGLGAGLVETFCAAAARIGLPGVHVVTAEGMRNVRFYEQNGFREEGRFTWNERTLVFLGRTLID